MSTRCPNCGGEKKDWAKVCWRCYSNAQIKEAEDRGYARGYQEGYRTGRRHVQDSSSKQPSFDSTRWRQLVQLAHPDKHGGSRTAVEVTQWLNKIRP